MHWLQMTFDLKPDKDLEISLIMYLTYQNYTGQKATQHFMYSNW